MRVNGGSGKSGGGGASGGSILIDVLHITGSGYIQSNGGSGELFKATLQDLLTSVPSMYILFNKFSLVYINQ